MINKEQSLFKQLIPHLIAVVTFLAITMIYFSPLMEGKVLSQGDVKQYQGASQEVREYYQKEGESSAWTGSMFSGMPTYQIGNFGGSPNFIDYIEAPLKALGSNSAGSVFAGMLMAYILFCVMGMRPTIAILGAIAYSLSSYNIIILEAGHVTKAWTIAYMPLVVAAMAAMFKRKLLLGGVLMALGLALQIKSNHLQITYYTALLCVVLYIWLVVDTLAKKEIKFLLKASGIFSIAIVIALACNAGNLYANWEMAKESTRGKSELSKPSDTEKQSSGLDKDYAFAWSYGKAETFSLMIPNIHGGVSRPFDENSESYKKLINLYQDQKISDQDANILFGGGSQYWGDQPFTSGPVYFGVIICFLFVMGMCLIRSNVKWGLLVATLFFIFLSWGKNMEWFNDLFFYHFPLYNKFRAVSTALVVPALTMVIVAIWGLNTFLSEKIDSKQLTKALYISTGVVGGLCLLFWMMPSAFFNFTSVNDEMRGLSHFNEYYQLILDQRKALLSADALRSLIFVLLAAALMFISLRYKGDKEKISLYVSLGLVVLVVIDLWGVDKRYLNDANFVNKHSYQTENFPQTTADKAILQDKNPSYRVLNLNNPFNESATSYYHKSIGGYHAAKLKRYQELIDNHLQQEIGIIGASFQSQNIDTIIASFQKTTALNMLNAKYIVYHPEQAPLVNPYILGNAWFVNEYKLVNNADEEIEAIKNLNAKHTAIVDKRFEKDLSGLNLSSDSTASIVLTDYKPNKLTYQAKTTKESLAVFSEIYFADGWQAYIDGKEAPHFRADWTLRAMRIPAGEHKIEFKFEPQDYYMTRSIATASSGLLILLVLGMIGFNLFKKKEENK